MSPRIVPSLIVLLLSATAATAQGTERYLPSGSQIALQVDAPEKSKAAFDKTAVGKLWNGETGTFAKAFYRWVLEAGELAATHFKHPAEDIALAKEAIKLGEKVATRGLAIGIEATSVLPPDARLVLVLNDAGSGEGNLPNFLGKVLDRAGVQPREVKIGNHSVFYFDLPGSQVGWWEQDGNAVVYLGTGGAAEYAKAIDDKKTGLAGHETFKKLAGLVEFPTVGRGFVDVPRLVKLGSQLGPQVDRVVEELGLKGMSSILWVTGYDGPAVRTISEVEIAGPRKGLLAFYTRKTIRLSDLPPLPDDLTGFSASNFNMNQVYTGLLSVIEGVARVYAPDQVDTVKEGIKAFEGILGINLQDVFTSFDDLTVQYNSPSEGFSLGGVYLLKVKDEVKLRKGLKTILQALPSLPGISGGLKTRNYRGTDIYEMHTNNPGNFTVPSLAIYKGYLCYAGYPQAVRGYIARMDGELPRWKANGDLTKALGAFPQEFTSIAVSDNRAILQVALGFLPPLIAGANGFTDKIPGLQPFDVSLVPHPQLATRGLFPSVTVTTDDGKKVRTDTRSAW